NDTATTEIYTLFNQLQPINVRLAHGTADFSASNANSFQLKASRVSQVEHCPSSKNVAVRHLGQWSCLMLILVLRSTTTIDAFVRASMKYGRGIALPGKVAWRGEP